MSDTDDMLADAAFLRDRADKADRNGQPIYANALRVAADEEEREARKIQRRMERAESVGDSYP